jgi:hypothetical protein
MVDAGQQELVAQRPYRVRVSLCQPVCTHLEPHRPGGCTQCVIQVGSFSSRSTTSWHGSGHVHPFSGMHCTHEQRWLLHFMAAQLYAWSFLGRYGSAAPKYGLWLQLENFGPLRYERGVSELSGRAVLQRHEATQIDIANMEGTGRVVSIILLCAALSRAYDGGDCTVEYLDCSWS